MGTRGDPGGLYGYKRTLYHLRDHLPLPAYHVTYGHLYPAHDAGSRAEGGGVWLTLRNKLVTPLLVKLRHF